MRRSASGSLGVFIAAVALLSSCASTAPTAALSPPSQAPTPSLSTTPPPTATGKVQTCFEDKYIACPHGIYGSPSDKPAPSIPPTTTPPPPSPSPKRTAKLVGDCLLKPWQDSFSLFEYKVTGEGTSSAASITYFNANGDIAQDTNARLPWHYCMYNPYASFLDVSAQNNNGSGNITCWTLWGGDVSDKTTAHGGYAICDAQG
jgi:hypothetical protein